MAMTPRGSGNQSIKSRNAPIDKSHEAAPLGCNVHAKREHVIPEPRRNQPWAVRIVDASPDPQRLTIATRKYGLPFSVGAIMYA